MLPEVFSILKASITTSFTYTAVNILLRKTLRHGTSASSTYDHLHIVQYQLTQVEIEEEKTTQGVSNDGKYLGMQLSREITDAYRYQKICYFFEIFTRDLRNEKILSSRVVKF